jgi:hypothetical protein
MNIQTQVSKGYKWFFWLILGAFSTSFAEVVRSSDLFPSFNAWGLIVVSPLYTLYILVLAHFVFCPCHVHKSATLGNSHLGTDDAGGHLWLAALPAIAARRRAENSTTRR